MSHNFRFGIQLSQPFAGRSWQDSAREIEAAGFSTLFVPDHFGDQLAPLTALAVAAEATTTLHVGALVFGNDYRHPVVLAKEIATLHNLSGGRVEFGLGAGWMTSDYQSSGISDDGPSTRVSRFGESITIHKALLEGETVNFAGDFYTIAGQVGAPVPFNGQRPKILVGAGGKRMLTFAGRHADIVGINPNMKAGVIGADAILDGMAEKVEQKIRWVRDAAGDRFTEIELNALVFLVNIAPGSAAFAENFAGMFGVSNDDIVSSPLTLIGDSTAAAAELLYERRERWGLSYHVFQGDAFEMLKPLVAELSGR